jgi:hypothetical protein
MASPCLAQSQSILPVEVSVPFVPPPVKGNGKYHLAYEVHMTNFWRHHLRLERVEVFDPKTSSLLSTVEGAGLVSSLFQPKHPTDSSDPDLVQCGRRAVAYVWLTFDSQRSIPHRAYHRLTFSVVDSDESSGRFVDGAAITVPHNDPPILGAPCSEGYWAVGNGPANSSEHRRSILAVDGSIWLLQRFAFDILKISAEGQIVRGDPAKNENWTSYGEELLAVADGVVSEVIDGIPDNTPLAPTRAVAMNRDTFVGNCVIIDIGAEGFALYAHIRAGSIPVRVGDSVKRGDVVGLIGNSGNSEAPHLHFSLGTANDPFSSEGIPYVFDSFDLVSVNLPGDEALIEEGVPGEELTQAKRQRCTLEMPIGDPVLYFHAE